MWSKRAISDKINSHIVLFVLFLRIRFAHPESSKVTTTTYSVLLQTLLLFPVNLGLESSLIKKKGIYLSRSTEILHHLVLLSSLSGSTRVLNGWVTQMGLFFLLQWDGILCLHVISYSMFSLFFECSGSILHQLWALAPTDFTNVLKGYQLLRWCLEHLFCCTGILQCWGTWV